MTLDIIGSKSRLELLRHLSRRDMYISEIMELVGLDGKTAKYHLDRLEEHGIITSNWKGRRKYYSLIREVIVRISPPPNRRFEVQFPLAKREEAYRND